MKKTLTLFLMAIYSVSMSGFAQTQSEHREDALDPTPVDRTADPDINMFLSDWRDAVPRNMYGNLVFHDILTPLDSDDPVRPHSRGAVLTLMTTLSYATLDPGVTVRGRTEEGTRQVFYTESGTGNIRINRTSHDLSEGSGFVLTPNFAFEMTNTGTERLGFYVRSEPLTPDYELPNEFTVMSRFDNDRRVGAHWVHICNGGPGPRGMNLCTIAPHTMPHPHSHPREEVWIMVKGETILSLGKNLVRMRPGQAYKIPPTGLAAHSNINMSDEPVQMIFMGPLVRGENIRQDFARLDNNRIDPVNDPDLTMFMGNWRDAYPRIEHGNLYFRDMLTAMEGPDTVHPARRSAVLLNARAVSYAMLEPRSTAHPVEGGMQGIQQTYVVNSGTGVINSGRQTFELSKGMAFILTPGLDFQLTAIGDKYLTFYVVSEELPQGFQPGTTLQVVDRSDAPQATTNWYNEERALITREDGLSQYGAINQVQLPSMAMPRPYSVVPGVEEIWIATEGDVKLLIGKKILHLPAGTAYRVPSTGIDAHAPINLTGATAEFLFMTK